jgi:hypothetical protein
VPAKGTRIADIDASSRVPPHQLGHLDIQLAGIKYPVLDLGDYTATDVNGATLIYTPGNLVTSGGLMYLCVTQTTAAPPGADWRVFDKTYFALRSDRVWDGGMPIFVGTAGVDGVDALLTPESPPFQNGWTNSLGNDPPVSFVRTVTGFIHISGGFYGGSNGTVVFTLPLKYRPASTERFVIGTSADNHVATYHVLSTGDVVFGQII